MIRFPGLVEDKKGDILCLPSALNSFDKDQNFLLMRVLTLVEKYVDIYQGAYERMNK